MIERRTGQGFFLIGDAHVAATPPGLRQEGYLEQVLAKITACLQRARELDMVPVFLGDLFHWPRENPNAVLVELIELLRPHKPFVLVGNHDKYQARFTPDVSMAVLAASGAVHVMSEPGPHLLLDTDDARVMLGATPDGYNLPKNFTPDPELGPVDHVLWVSHHNLSFPAYPDKQIRLREIPGVDWVINGHLHTPQPTVRVGSTRYANPGNIVRLTFSQKAFERIPAASVWRPGCDDLETWPIPHLPAKDVFPDQEPPPSPDNAEGRESSFLHGLERLALRRTAEGAGLKEFLTINIDNGQPAAKLVWELYEEVVRGRS